MIYQIDGQHFSTLEEFYEELSDTVFAGETWGKNLDALVEMLRGREFLLKWYHSDLSRERMGDGPMGFEKIVEIFTNAGPGVQLELL